MQSRKLELNPTADIVPNQGLGGLTLRINIQEIDHLLTDLLLRGREGFFHLASVFEARYKFEDYGIEVAVDVRNGKIFKLIARPGYGGKLFSKIKTGMRVKDAMNLEPRLYYDEAEEKVLCKDVSGVTIDIREINPNPEAVPSLNIYTISVYAEESMTLQGQSGCW